MAWLFRTKEGGGTIGSATQLELKTNPEQMQLIIALMNDLQEQIQNTYAAGPDNGPEASAQLSKDEVRRMVRDINVSGEEVLSVILDSKQYARARQLMWQYIKYRAFERVDFVKEMKLTKKQKTAIAKIMKKQTITADDEDDISDLLTTDQHKQWLELKGPVFSYFARRRLPEAG